MYNGMTFSMSTGEVLEHGEVSYVAPESISNLGGGGSEPQTSTSTSGISEKAYGEHVSPLLSQARQALDSGELSKVAGFTPDQLQAMQMGRDASGRQTGLEQSLLAQANQGVDLSGMRTAATQQAQSALGSLAGAAGRTGNLGGSRQMLNQQGISQDLAARFAGIDQQEQATNFANKQAALGAQGQGASLLGQVGGAQQQQSQAEADTTYQGLSRMAGFFGALPQTSTTEQTGGGK